jgi:hypothetical protein
VALLTAAALASAHGSLCSGAATQPTAAGSWQAHRYEFQYLGYNTTYSCGGLTEKLRLLLRTVAARHVRVTPVCLGNPGLPDRFAQADLRFETLVPEGRSAGAGSAAMTPGVWQHVRWTAEKPRTLGPGDCSLMQQLLAQLVPMLPTRNLQTKFDCAANHDYGAFDVSFEVFVPAESSK